jgi:hypothetical protein
MTCTEFKETKRRRREVSKDKCNDKRVCMQLTLQVADGEENEMGCWNLERLCRSLIGVGNVGAVVGPLRIPMEPRLASRQKSTQTTFSWHLGYSPNMRYLVWVSTWDVCGRVRGIKPLLRRTRSLTRPARSTSSR